jgi:hypothetical protein
MPTPDAPLEPIHAMLRRVELELVKTAHLDNVFWQVQAIIRDNEALAGGGIFQEWIGRRYVDSVTIALRRQADQRPDVESLWRLLERMKSVATLLTKAHYIALHDADPHFRSSAGKFWDRAIAPGLDTVTRALIHSKQKDLNLALEKVSNYASDYVTHTAGRPRAVSMTFEEVRVAMVTAFKLYRWCSLAVKAEAHYTPVPSIPEPWLKTFRSPWLEPGPPPRSIGHSLS